MWIRFSSWLYRVASSRVTLAALVAFLAFSALVLPGQSAAARESAHGAGSPDTMLFYSPDRLFEMAEAHGDAGRTAYVRARWSFDVAFPVVYGAFLATSISWLLSRVIAAGSMWRLANLAPVFAVIFDFCENTCTSLVMLAYPERIVLTAALAAIFTPVKWFFVVLSFVLLVTGLVLWLRRRAA